MICEIHTEAKGYNTMRVEPQYCPYCKIGQLTAERNELRDRNENLEGVLNEIDINYSKLHEENTRLRVLLQGGM